MKNNLLDKYILEDEREKLWQLAFDYETEINLEKIMDFYILKRDAYYVCELICIVCEHFNLDDVFNKIILTKDVDFIKGIFINGPIQGLIDHKYFCMLRNVLLKLNQEDKIISVEHKMNLHNDPFLLIKNGIKTIELRLNDEKRQLLRVNDIIEFTNRVSNEIIKVKIIKLHKFDNFNELYKHFNKVSMGYNESDDADPKDMEKYYSKEEQAKYGVVGIEIELIN